MKRTFAILALATLATTALALPRHLVMVAHMDTWGVANTNKAINECEKYIDGPMRIAFSIYRTNSVGELYGCSPFWYPQWTKKADKLDDGAKLDTLNAKLGREGMMLLPGNDWRAVLTGAGLASIAASSTTTTATSTTITTTTAEEQ